MEQLVDTVATVSKTQSQNESITTVIIPKIIQQIPCSLQFNDWFPPLKYTLISPFDKIIETHCVVACFFQAVVCEFIRKRDGHVPKNHDIRLT